jgi:hypothetical protein
LEIQKTIGLMDGIVLYLNCCHFSSPSSGGFRMGAKAKPTPPAGAKPETFNVKLSGPVARDLLVALSVAMGGGGGGKKKKGKKT